MIGEIPGRSGTTKPVLSHVEFAVVLEDDRKRFDMAAAEILHDLSPADAVDGVEPSTLETFTELSAASR